MSLSSDSPGVVAQDTSREAMELSLVIPVWNDRDGLIRLLQRVEQWDCFSQIIVVDDASDPDHDLTPDHLPVAQELRARIRYLRISERRGAGHARNSGLDLVTTSHVIFFDSDDLFTDDFVSLAERASGLDFDFLIFRHDDSRMIASGKSGSFPAEEGYWTAVDATSEPQLLTRAQAVVLCRVANYPWNKIYRTGFLRDQRIRCTEVMVHNDIALHWTSFLLARRIFCSSMIGAVHFVAHGGGRLTNRRGAERLQAFDTLGDVARRIRSLPVGDICRFAPPFFHFARSLQDWIGRNLDDIHHPEMQARAKALYLDHLDRDLMVLIAHDDPALAGRINRTIRGEETI